MRFYYYSPEMTNWSLEFHPGPRAHGQIYRAQSVEEDRSRVSGGLPSTTISKTPDIRVRPTRRVVFVRLKGGEWPRSILRPFGKRIRPRCRERLRAALRVRER